MSDLERRYEEHEWLDMSPYDLRVTRLQGSKFEYLVVSDVVPRHRQALLAAGGAEIPSRPDLCVYRVADQAARSKVLSDLEEAFPLSRMIDYVPETHCKNAALIRGGVLLGVLQHPSTLGSPRVIQVKDVVWSGLMGFEPRGRHARVDPRLETVCIDRVDDGYRLSIADFRDRHAYEEVTVSPTIEAAIATMKWVVEGDDGFKSLRDRIDHRRTSVPGPDDLEDPKVIVLGFDNGRIEYKQKRWGAGWRIPATTVQDVLPTEYPDIATLLSTFQARKEDLSEMVRRVEDERDALLLKSHEERIGRRDEAAPPLSPSP